MKHLLTLFGVCLVTSPLLAQPEKPLHPTLHRTGPAIARNATAAAAAAKLPSDPHSRISRDLQQLYQFANGGAPGLNRGTATTAAVQAAFPQLSVINGTGPASVLVRITAQNVALLRPALEARGFVTIAAKDKFHFLEGELPVSQLAPGAAGLAALAPQGLLGVVAVWQPITHTGRIENQADYGLQANRVRAAKPTGYDGSGFRIGVMSDSYNALGGAPAGVASGDLPANVLVLQDRGAGQGTDEGRGMVELIHDIAPGAGQAFSAVFRGEADFADQMLRLADPTLGNCKIIVDDISYLGEPMFQDGVVAQAVDEASARLGVAYFGSAGNAADASSEYASPVFAPLAAAANGADLDFGASFKTGGATDTRQHFSIPKTGNLLLFMQWSDPFYTTKGVKTDLDMYLIKTRPGGLVLKGDTVAISNDDNLASQTPLEAISYTNNNDTDTEFDLVINRRAGTANPGRVKYISYGDNIVPTEYFTRSSTVTGHHAAINEMSVAAVPSYSRLRVETFTSLGGPTYLFNPDGSPLAAPVVRAKPDFSSIDGVSTTFFGQKFANQDPKDGFLFFGTSAAAPNAAAVAALLLQANPSFTPVQLKDRLKTTAKDINAPGYDYLSGSGLINAYDAIFGAQTTATGPFVETFDSPGLSRAWELQGNTNARILVRSDFGPASTPGHLVMDAILPYALNTPSNYGPRRNEATLKLNLSTAPTGGWVLTFKQKKFTGEVDDVMPATFSNSVNADGVAMSVDGGTTWYSLTTLTGTAATTTYQTMSLNLSTFAQGKSLALGADVRLRFQQFGAGQTDTYNRAAFSGGRAFDDVIVAGANAVQAPVALFGLSATAAPICPGSSVQFTDASLFSPTSYAWSFPGGTPTTSTDPNPVVVYNTAGTYDVTLTVTNASGSSTKTQTGAVTVSTVVPTANFTARQAPICAGGVIKFTNRSFNCASAFTWTFPGGTPATSTDVNPTVTFNTPGTYTVTLVAANSNGASPAKTFTVQVQGASLAIPFAETFSAGIPSAWGVLNPDGRQTWTSAPNILRKDGTRGTAVVMPFSTYAAVGQRDSLQSPTLDLRTPKAAFLHFDLAYAPATGYNDSLAVDVFTACTNTSLGRVYLKSANSGLATTLPRDNTIYTPTATSQWRQEDVSLATYLGQQVYLRFVAFNQYGNNLYLSNVRVDALSPLAARTQADSPLLQAYPNPVAGGAILNLELPQAQGKAAIRVIDALGRVSSQVSLTLSPDASTHYKLTSPVAAGLYTVLCQTADGQFYSRRVVVK